MCKYRKILVMILISGLVILTGSFIFVNLTDSSNVSDTQADGRTQPVFENISEMKVIPSGEPVGIYLKTEGVLVVDVGEFTDMDGKEVCPVRGLLETGDYITKIDDEEIENKSELMDILKDSEGEKIKITFERNDVTGEVTVEPHMSEDGSYKLGLWVKDDISGIGTITFIYKDNYMALGHSVSDNDTGLMISLSDGGIYSTNIFQIDKSADGIPGQLEGTIVYKRDLIGKVKKNMSGGIYGSLDKEYIEENYSEDEEVSIATSDEVHTGKAYICSRLSGEKKMYEINITGIKRASEVKNIEFTVVDSELLSLTGGIVQGMSGSPILQDGKLIGAVTHVLVNDSTKGYGIFIESMLE